ncbi:hypothetical protein GCM10027026_08580 [Myroides odoratimimus subsp. xuanwuensis]
MALGLVLSGCQPASDQADPEMSDVPVGAGGLPTDAVLWALGDTIHVDDRTIRVDRRVSAMVEANGWIFYRKGYSDVVWATDGEESRRTSLRTDELAASESGRYLGLLDHSRGKPWSTVIVDLESGEVVVRDGAGMGNLEGDLTDLYEDAQPRVLGFDGERLLVQTASGNEVMSWDPRTGERTEHGDQFFFAGRDPGGGLIQPALVRRGRLVVPEDPYRSTQWGHASPDGTVTVMPVYGGAIQVFEVGGRRLPTDLHGRRFILGGWTDDETAYGIAFDRSPFGPHRVRLVSCRLTVEQRRCRVLRTIRPAPHELVHFPHGSAARDY